MDGLLGIREAAAALGVNASTVSRWVKGNPGLNHGAGKRPQVDLAELRAHRADNVNAAMAGNHAGRVLGEEPEGPEPDGAGGSGAKRSPSLVDAKTVREAALAQTAQLDLQERLGKIVDTAGVEDGAFEAGQILRELLTARNRRLGDKFASMSDSRELTAALDADDRDRLERLGEAIHERIRTKADAAAA